MRTIQSRTLTGPLPISFGRTVKESFLTVDRLLATWQTRREERERLRQMPDYLLRDVGITEEQVREETRKPFWRE